MIALMIVVSFFLYPSFGFTEITVTRIVKLAASFLMFAGFCSGWKWELAAGIMILVGYLIVAVINGIFFLNWMHALFPVIGSCYLLSGLYDRIITARKV